MKKTLGAATTILLSFYCGIVFAEPSENELYRAVVNFTNSNPMASAFNVRILRTKKLSCSKVGSNEFICLVDCTATSDLLGTITNRERYRLLRTRDGWEMIDNLH
jgi:hypothetical protein